MDFHDEVTRVVERVGAETIGEERAVAVVALLTLVITILQSTTVAPPPQIVEFYRLSDAIIDRFIQINIHPMMRES